MIKSHLSEYSRGWIIGDFAPSLLRTRDFEVAVLHHAKGEYWAPHVHKIATEFNVLISGSMVICGDMLEPGDVFVISPGEVADPVFLEDCVVVCVKVPSLPGDKHEVFQGSI